MRLDRPHLLDYLCTVELILVDFIDYALNHTLRSAFSNGQLVISLFITFCTLDPAVLQAAAIGARPSQPTDLCADFY